MVYHGSTEIIKQPDVLHSYRLLDFGQGFYVTTVKEQAMRWARRKAGLQKDKPAIVNCYRMIDDIDGLKHKTFPEDLMEWIDFVCKCRDGNEDYKDYDLISGKVANDKVFRSKFIKKNWKNVLSRKLLRIRIYRWQKRCIYIMAVTWQKRFIMA